MSAINQVFMGLFSAVGSVVSGITSLVNKWYPVSVKDNTSTISKIKWVNGKAWSFTYSSAALTSTNGIDWETVWPGSALGAGFGNILLQDIAYGAGRYVIVCGSTAGGTAIILTSTDGVTWTRSPVSFSATFNAIDYSPTLNMFLAGAQTGAVSRSSDGITWTAPAVPAGMGSVAVNTVLWAGDRFIAGQANGTVARSTNGVNFTAASVTTSVNDIAYSPSLGMYALVRNSGQGTIVMTSTDAATWTARPVTGISASLTPNGVVWSGSSFVFTTNTGGVGSSVDGQTWALANAKMIQLGKMCVTDTGVIVAATSTERGTAVSTDNGVTWGAAITESASQVGMFRSSDSKIINTFQYSGDRYWVTGSNTGDMYFSYDNNVWYTPAIPAGVTTGSFYTPVYASSAAVPYWVSPGTTSTAGRIYSSFDGNTWTLRSVTTQGSAWTAAATNGVTTVLINSSGAIATTTDGVTFVNRTSGTVAVLRSIVYAGGKFIAIGASIALYSTDGATWAAAASYGSFNGNKLIHDGTQFVAVGTGTATINTKVSADGVTWTTGPVAPWGTTAINSFAFNGSVYAAKSGSASSIVYVGATLSTLAAVNLSATVGTGTDCLTTEGSKFIMQTQYNSIQLSSIDNGVTWQTWQTSEPANGGQSNVGVKSDLQILEGQLVSPRGTTQGYGAIAFYNPENDTWTRKALPNGIGAYTVTKVGTAYIVGSGNGAQSGSVIVSTDNMASWGSKITATGTFRTVAANANGSIIVAGSHGGGSAQISNNNLIVSTNGGATFALGNTGASTLNVARVIHDGTQFVAVGQNSANQGQIVTSTNGTSWTGRYAATTENFTDVIFANGLYIAVSQGSGFKFFTSTDGITWTGRGLTTYGQMWSIAYGNGTFWAVGGNGVAYSTTNGTVYNTDTISFAHMSSIVWDGVDSFWAMNSRGTLYKYTPQ